MWITQDDANLEPGSGGLDVWDVAVPAGLPFFEFNNHPFKYVNEEDSNIITIPYKANRVVIFNSHLIHKTGSLRFKEGFLNRRINLTYLFGTPEDDCAGPSSRVHRRHWEEMPRDAHMQRSVAGHVSSNEPSANRHIEL